MNAAHVRHPFPPVVGDDPRVLILGTMPSPASMREGGYYGHPQNDFWPIMVDLLATSKVGLFGKWKWEFRYKLLRDNHIALWDVLAECVRVGASDASIYREVANDVGWLLENRRTIRAVAMNGRTAQDLFAELITPKLRLGRDLRFIPLPSTSPAYAVPFETKMAAWRALTPYIGKS